MKQEFTLMVLAAGMGSRFGGLKQVAPMGPNGEFIIDYSVHDAIEAGFTKIVFLIKKENYELFKSTIGKRVEPHVKVEYCFQDNSNVPKEYTIPESRVKPLGTAHAILCCKDKVTTNCAMINADDFYGKDSFVKAVNFLKTAKNNEYGLVSYLVKNTITENGSVKRGLCTIENNMLTEIRECKISIENNKYIAEPLLSAEKFEVKADAEVSMNLLLFTPSIFEYIERKFPIFLEENKDKLDTCEFLIPDVLRDSIKENYATVKVIKTSSSWYGVTYKEDTDFVKKALQELVEIGQYKNNLWK